MNRRGQRSDIAAANSAVRASLYMRVSTSRQDEHDLSVPDQQAQLTSWCKAKGWEIVAEFIEPGATASDDKRRVFQQMVERACDGEHAFDVIVVQLQPLLPGRLWPGVLSS
jgi:site-specific DNA recombinase